MTTVDKDESLKRAQAHTPQTSSDFDEGLSFLLMLLFIAGLLFGVAYLVGLGWHAAMR